MLSLLIASMAYVFAISGGSFRLLVTSQAGFLIGITCIVLLSVKRSRVDLYNIAAWFVLAIILVGNVFINLKSYSHAETSANFAILHIGGVIVAAFGIQWADRNLKPILILEYLAWMLAPLAIIVFMLGWGAITGSIRFKPFGIQPNWWGEIALALIFSAFAVRQLSVKTLFILFGLVLLLFVQSRGALLAALVAILIQLLLRLKAAPKTAPHILIIISLLFFTTTTIFGLMGWVEPAIYFIKQKIVLIDHPYRGLGTGLVGRLEGWFSAITIFSENPILGGGFDTLSNVHNGFLRMAGEGGVLLLGMIVLMMFCAMVKAWQYNNFLTLSVLPGIGVYFLTYPRMLNLNVLGIIFIFCLFSSAKPKALGQ